jgi:hypothetical protein
MHAAFADLSRWSADVVPTEGNSKKTGSEHGLVANCFRSSH